MTVAELVAVRDTSRRLTATAPLRSQRLWEATEPRRPILTAHQRVASVFRTSRLATAYPSPDHGPASFRWEQAMDFTAQLDTLKKRVDDTISATRSAAAEDRTKLEQRIQKAEVDANLALKDTEQKAGAAKDRAASKWAQAKVDAAAKMDDVKAKIAKRNQLMNADAAAADAEMAENDARAAISFASWAVDNARVAILDALDAAACSSQMNSTAAKS